MAETFTLSISNKNRQASTIINKWKHSGVNISDIFCEFVIEHEKEMQLSAASRGVPVAAGVERGAN